MSKYTGMKVLEIDIETAPATAYIWDLKTRYVPIKHVIETGYTLCFAARWQHEKRIRFYSVWKDGVEGMVQAAYDLLDEADVVVHYNGRKFDIPRLNREFVKAGLVPPTNYKHIDLYQTVRSTFDFMSNGMDHVCEELGLQTKLEHKGMELWTGCMAGNRADRATMRKYNCGDVEMLRQLYYKLQPWIRAHPNRGLYVDDPQDPVCPTCGGTHLQKRGIERPARVNAYQRFKCVDCGANSRGRIIVKKADRENVLL